MIKNSDLVQKVLFNKGVAKLQADIRADEPGLRRDVRASKAEYKAQQMDPAEVRRLGRNRILGQLALGTAIVGFTALGMHSAHESPSMQPPSVEEPGETPDVQPASGETLPVDITHHGE